MKSTPSLLDLTPDGAHAALQGHHVNIDVDVKLFSLVKSQAVKTVIHSYPFLIVIYFGQSPV